MKQINAYDDYMNANNIKLAALDLNLITALHALLEHQSVSAAAEAVGRTQSAMSHSLSRLRAHFHDPILVRDGWAMRLTPFGEELRPRATAAAHAARVMFRTDACFDPATTTRRIRIAVPDLCISLFTGLIADISREAPLASVEFIDGGMARQAVLRSEAELGLGFGSPKPDPNLLLNEMAPLAWCTFAPLDHEYASEPSAATWSASRHIVVAQGRAGEGPVERALRKSGLERHVLCYASSFAAALGLAAETGALFTTLRAPFEGAANRIGMTARPLPFNMPDAPATLIFGADYGDPYLTWLREQCLRSLT